MHHWHVALNTLGLGAKALTTLSAGCPTGYEVMGGGAWSDESPYGIKILGSAPGSSKWRVSLYNTRDVATMVGVFAICFTRSE